MSQTVIRELVARFKGDTSDLERAMETALGSIKSFAADATVAASPVGAVFGGAALAIGGLGVAFRGGTEEPTGYFSMNAESVVRFTADTAEFISTRKG